MSDVRSEQHPAHAALAAQPEPPPVAILEGRLALEWVDHQARTGRPVKFDHASQLWHEYRDGRWLSDKVESTTADLARYLRDQADRVPASQKNAGSVIRQFHSTRLISAVLQQSRTLPGVGVEGGSHWDAQPHLLGCRGCTVDLQSGEARSPDHRDNIRLSTGINPDAGARPERWLRFVDEILQGDAELVRWLQKAIGYSATGLTREHIFLFLHGSGGNGKSVLIRTIQRAMGEYSHVAPSSLFVRRQNDDHPAALADLQGHRCVVSSEIEEGSRWDTEAITKLTGGDRVNARWMRGNPFVFEPRFTLWMVANTRPSLPRSNAAIARRMRLVPFSFTPDPPDAALAEKLEVELPGILAWIIEGAVAYFREGLSDAPEIVRIAGEDYQEDSKSIVQLWIDETCTSGPEDFTDGKSLYRSFNHWCDGAGVQRPPTQKGFYAMLSEIDGVRRERTRRGVSFRGIAIDTDVQPDDSGALDDGEAPF